MTAGLVHASLQHHSFSTSHVALDLERPMLVEPR